MKNATEWFKKNKEYCKFSAKEIMNFIQVDAPSVVNHSKNKPIVGAKDMPPKVVRKNANLRKSHSFRLTDIHYINQSLKSQNKHLVTHPSAMLLKAPAIDYNLGPTKNYVSSEKAFNIAVRNINLKRTNIKLNEAKNMQEIVDMINRVL
jgi:hypothetical protein